MPRRGGHAWVFAQWLLGLRTLGFEVVFVDRLEAPTQAEIYWLRDVMTFVDLADSWALRTRHDTIGPKAADLVDWFTDADVCIDIMGHAPRDLLALARCTVLVDIDPGFGQWWQQLGQAEVFGRHHRYATVGLAVGTPRSAVPTLGIDWITMPPPVSLTEWPEQTQAGTGVTSVATWRGPFDPIEVDGARLGLRAHQFRGYLDVPRTSGQTIELALEIDPADASDAAMLRQSGYRLTDPLVAAGDLTSYREFVQRSAAELCVAKDLYVRTRGGWFSDRSACYLASGRPVVHHDTGFDARLPTGEGLLTFHDPASASAAIAAVTADPEAHGQAARALAVEYFEASSVIGRLIDQVVMS